MKEPAIFDVIGHYINFYKTQSEHIIITFSKLNLSKFILNETHVRSCIYHFFH